MLSALGIVRTAAAPVGFAGGGGGSGPPTADWLDRKDPVINVKNLAAGNFNDLSLTGYRNTDWLLLIVAGNVTITGFAKPLLPADNRLMQVTLHDFATDNDTVTLIPASGSSALGNRIVTPNRQPLILKRYESAWLWWNGNEWWVVDVSQDSATVAAAATVTANTALTNAATAQATAAQAAADVLPLAPAAIASAGTSGAAITISFATNHYREVTLNDPTPALTLTFPRAGTYYLRVLQDVTGNRVPTWAITGGGTKKAPGGVAPVLSTAGGAVDWVKIIASQAAGGIYEFSITNDFQTF